jgi:hypothetical protein
VGKQGWAGLKSPATTKKKWRREQQKGTADKRIIRKRIVSINMTHSEWICNTCEERFETKERRNEHRQRIHRRMMSIGMIGLLEAKTEVKVQGMDGGIGLGIAVNRAWNRRSSC